MSTAAPTLQPPLIALDPIRQPDYGDHLTIEERFAIFHEENPHVMTAIVRLCRDLQAHGVQRWSTKAAYENLRYRALRTFNQDDYKLNNDYTAIYAREIMARYPDLAGFFETRERKAETAW